MNESIKLHMHSIDGLVSSILPCVYLAYTEVMNGGMQEVVRSGRKWRLFIRSIPCGHGMLFLVSDNLFRQKTAGGSFRN